jgi:hypothetical protein
MHKMPVPYLVFGVCSTDFSAGGLGGAFLPHAEIKGASKTATKHIKTKPFLKNFFIPQSIFILSAFSASFIAAFTHSRAVPPMDFLRLII